ILCARGGNIVPVSRQRREVFCPEGLHLRLHFLVRRGGQRHILDAGQRRAGQRRGGSFRRRFVVVGAVSFKEARELFVRPAAVGAGTAREWKSGAAYRGDEIFHGG